MASRTRRALLKVVGALTGGLAGCQSSGEPSPESSTATSTRTSNPPPTGTQTETTTHPFRCGPGPRPETAWPLPQRGATHDNYVADGPAVDGPPSVWWTAEPTVPPDVDAYEATFSQPVVVDDLLYAVSRVQFGANVSDPGGHTLQARDRSTGEVQWSYRLPRRPSTPAVRGDDVLVLSEDTLYALDRHDGSERWTRTLDAFSAVPAGDRIYVAGERLSALTPDGTTAWTRSFDADVAEPPAVGAAGVYAALVGGEVVALDPATGQTKWTVQTPLGDAELKALSPNVNTVVVTDCEVFVVTDGDIHAFDKTGEFQWHVESYVSRVATDGTTLYSRDRKPDPFRTVLRARDAATGQIHWEQSFAVASSAHGVLSDSALYAPTGDALLAVGPDDGRTLWEATPAVESLALADGVLFGTRLSDGSLVALR